METCYNSWYLSGFDFGRLWVRTPARACNATATKRNEAQRCAALFVACCPFVACCLAGLWMAWAGLMPTGLPAGSLVVPAEFWLVVEAGNLGSTSPCKGVSGGRSQLLLSDIGGGRSLNIPAHRVWEVVGEWAGDAGRSARIHNTPGLVVFFFFISRASPGIPYLPGIQVSKDKIIIATSHHARRRSRSSHVIHGTG